MNNPFRTAFYQKSIKNQNRLTTNEFCMSVTNSNGTFVRLEEINEMIKNGIITVDYDKLEQRVYDKTVM